MCEKAFGGRGIVGRNQDYYPCNDGTSDQCVRQWYVSETRHGTVMAHLILRVCPMAKIYPIRLDTIRDMKGVPRINPGSAAKVRFLPFFRHTPRV